MLKTVLAEMLGEAAVRTLSRDYGGLALVVPKKPAGWVLDLPEGVGEKLCAVYGGDRVYIPKLDAGARLKRDAAIIAAYDAGERVQDLARQYKLTERRVRTILGRPLPVPEEDRQGSLF